MKQTPAHDFFNDDLLAFIPRDCWRVVEVGCSTGALARAYLRINPACRYIGVEIDRDYADAARKICAEVVVGDVEQMPAERFESLFACDCVIFGDILEHLRDPWDVLRRIRPLLRDGGRVVACIPNAQHWSVQARLACGLFRYEDSGLLDRTHLRWFTRITALELLQTSGFRVVEGRPRIFPEAERDRFLPAIMAMAEAAGVDPNQAVADALPLQYVMAAIPERPV